MTGEVVTNPVKKEAGSPKKKGRVTRVEGGGALSKSSKAKAPKKGSADNPKGGSQKGNIRRRYPATTSDKGTKNVPRRIP